MKKLLSILLVLVTLMAFSFNAMAVDFTVSVENKGAPDIVETEDNGLYDKDGNLVHQIEDDCITVIPFGDVVNSNDLTEDEKKLMQDLYEELSKSDTSLSVICPELDDLIKEKLGDDYNADDLVIRDFFTVKELCDELQEKGDDGTIKITFDLGIAADEFITAMVYLDGKWQVVPVVNNGDGTVTVTFTELGPVAFLTPDGTIIAPTTGDTDYSQIIFWSVVMVAALVAIVAVLLTSRKKKSDVK